MSLRKTAAATSLLLAVTVLSKFVGFAREFILLEIVGIGRELDMFLVLFAIANLVSGALGICIVTSVTPLARQFPGREGSLLLMKEGTKVGLATGLLALIACFLYVVVAGDASSQSTLMLALVVPAIVPFSLLAEYQVGLFLARGQLLPVISGNLIISLPLAIALLIINIDIVSYAAGLVAAFAARSAVFYWLLRRGPPGNLSSKPAATSLFGKRLFYTIGGGSAMLAMSALYLTATMFAREFGPGQATLIGYGLKVPMFVLTSAWFVLGTGYFSDLVSRGTAGVMRRIAELTLINLGLFGAFLAVILALRSSLLPLPSSLHDGSEILTVIKASLPFLPLIVFVPLIEMVQRLAVMLERHSLVPLVALSVLFVGLSSQAIAVFYQMPLLVSWSAALGAGAGALAALCVVFSVRQFVTHASKDSARK